MYELTILFMLMDIQKVKGVHKMSKIAYLFPGQGSQIVGMGKDIAAEYEKAKMIFKKADERLGYSLSSLCFDGPEEELKLTYHTQPALLTTSMALYQVAKDFIPKADFVAGHSLGEYSALVAAEAISFEDAVYAVSKRGQFMDEAVPAGLGAMSAVIGGDREVIESICKEVYAEGTPVQLANINCPGQITISGLKEGVEKATILLKEAGIKKIIPLVVSGPFHSDLMKTASNKLESVLNQVIIRDAAIPVVANVSANVICNATEIKEALLAQVYSSVLWEESIRKMVEQGVTIFIEIGPGKVLTGLVKKISKEVAVYNIFDINSLKQTRDALSVKG